MSDYRTCTLVLYFSDHPAAQSFKQQADDVEVSTSVESSPLTETSAMLHISDSVVSSPVSKSIDPSPFTDTSAVAKVSESIDPSAFTETSPEPHVYDSPPTAADQETQVPSKADESSQKTGDKLNVNDVLLGN